MSANETTPTTPNAAVAASAPESGSSAPAARRHSTTRRATRTSAAEKAAREAEERELLQIVEEFCKTAGVTMEATVAIADSNIRARAVTIRQARIEEKKKEDEKKQAAEKAQKVEEARKLLAAMDAAVPKPEPAVEKTEGNVVQLRPAAPSAVEEFKNGFGKAGMAPAASKPERKLDRAQYIVLPEIVFTTVFFASGFRLVCLWRQAELKKLAEAESDTVVKGALKSARFNVLRLIAEDKDARGRGSVNHLTTEWYGAPAANHDSIKASPKQVEEVEKELAADPQWSWLVGKAVSIVAQAKPETAEEKATREVAETEAAEAKKVEEKALKAEMKKRLMDAGATEEAAGKMASRLVDKGEGAAESRLLSAAVGKLEFARGLPDTEADKRLEAEIGAEQYAKAGGKTLAEVEAMLEAKKTEQEAKAEVAKAEQEAKSAERARQAAKREAQKKEAERVAAAKKAAKNRGNKGKGGK